MKFEYFFSTFDIFFLLHEGGEMIVHYVITFCHGLCIQPFIPKKKNENRRKRRIREDETEQNQGRVRAPELPLFITGLQPFIRQFYCQSIWLPRSGRSSKVFSTLLFCFPSASDKLTAGTRNIAQIKSVDMVSEYRS